MRLADLPQMIANELQRVGLTVIRARMPTTIGARAMLAAAVIVVDDRVTDERLVNWLTAHELMHALGPTANLLRVSPVIADALERGARRATALFCLRLDRYAAAMESGCVTDAEMAAALQIPEEEYRKGVDVLKQVFGVRPIQMEGCVLQFVNEVESWWD